MKKQVVIYTDGACSGNPGPGGWGAILQWNGKQKEISGFVENTTNNRMELLAIISAFQQVKEPCHIKLHSDSAYVINAFKQGWIDNWIRNQWKKADKKPVENQDLWNDLLDATEPHDVEWIKVKGHSTDELNNRADFLATQEISKNKKGGK